jgi:hypothetical protein
MQNAKPKPPKTPKVRTPFTLTTQPGPTLTPAQSGRLVALLATGLERYLQAVVDRELLAYNEQLCVYTDHDEEEKPHGR